MVKKIKIPVYGHKADKKGDVNLSGDVWRVKANPDLVAQAVRVYLSNQRRATAKTKNRSEIRGSRRKVWAQKGSGRARHGDIYAPIFVGGGRAHGPTGEQNYKLKLPKKMKKKALAGVLTDKLENKRIKIVAGFNKIKPKTKNGYAFLQRLIGKDFAEYKRYLLVLNKKDDKIWRIFRNIDGLNLILAADLNPYIVLNHDYLIFTEKAINEIK